MENELYVGDKEGDHNKEKNSDGARLRRKKVRMREPSKLKNDTNGMNEKNFGWSSMAIGSNF